MGSGMSILSVIHIIWGGTGLTDDAVADQAV
jgi:hypothetical protein